MDENREDVVQHCSTASDHGLVSMEMPEISGGMAILPVPMRSTGLFHAELPHLVVSIRMQESFPIIQSLPQMPNKVREKFSGAKDVWQQRDKSFPVFGASRRYCS
jgi:hypothetical protein